MTWMKVRQWLSDHGAPRWVRVLAARPSEYMVARSLWDWPRRYALADTLATLCGRANYRWTPAGVGEKRRAHRREMLEEQRRFRETRCRCVLVPLDELDAD